VDEIGKEEFLRSLDQLEIKLEDLVQLDDEKFLCYAKDTSELDDPIAWFGWWPLDEINDDRLEALEAGAKPTDREIELMRDAVVRYRLSAEGNDESVPVYFCSAPEKFGTKVIVVLVSGCPLVELDYSLFGVFENEECATEALRKEFFLDCDIVD
jgi:hypothetical protein